MILPRLARLCLVLLAAIAAPPAHAEDQGLIPELRMRVVQNGLVVPMAVEGDGLWHVTLSAGPFAFEFPGGPPEAFAVTFGPDGLFDLLDRPPDGGFFGPGAAMARYERPDPVHYFTDPACLGPEFGPPFNLLRPVHAEGNRFPVGAILHNPPRPDCGGADALAEGVDLLGSVPRFYAVMQVTAPKRVRVIFDIAGM
ncbi:hypothetical protein HKCCSP123_12695 [Rhodobacterales bacterium HKCCSP123]|nr:hypothetical protein [Rhodobacterales bacterium HKCCSP123]